MSVHDHPAGTPEADVRDCFLVDGCERCAEFVENCGLSFEPDRYFAFWQKMIEVEYDWTGGYGSKLDKELGRRLYALSLGLQRVFGIDPRSLSPIAAPGHVELVVGRAEAAAFLESLADSALTALYAWRRRDHSQGPPAKFRVSPAADEVARAELQRQARSTFSTVKEYPTGGARYDGPVSFYGVPIEIDDSLSGAEVVCV